MSRPIRAPALAALVLLAATACQDYNFNPVGHCLIQPGTKRFTLSSVDTADILFVVDDSGSMAAEQQRLADAFDTFVTNLSQTNDLRRTQGLEPFGYHVAVTTTSVYWNYQTANTCTSSCPGASGQAVCCVGSAPARQPKRCTSSDQCGSGNQCLDTCAGWKGELVCCSAPDAAPPETELIPCSREGTICGTLETHYDFNAACSAGTVDVGVAVDQWPYPHGSFVGQAATTTANPRVLHFDKRLYKTEPQTNSQGFTRLDLEDFFKENVRVGVCGSGQEQALQAARLAIESALSGQQRDTYSYAALDENATPATTASWDGTKRLAGSAAVWPNPNSKLVVVFVGDEDDCSSPQDPSGGVVMLAEGPGVDACTRDATDPAPVGQKEFAVSSFVDYLTGLGRPLAAGFIFPAAQESCSGEGCTPGLCADPVCGRTDVCGAQAAGTRLYATAGELRGRGVDVVMGSICDNGTSEKPGFSAILDEIAEVVKPPSTLTLPSQPAQDAVTLLRIASSNGETRKLCGRPLAPGPATLTAAQDTLADWWFTQSSSPGIGADAGGPVAISRFVYINPKGSCRANPGETYSADYLGVVPAGGCVTSASDPDGSTYCRDRLGGPVGAFTCFVPPGASTGTCTCSGSTP